MPFFMNNLKTNLRFLNKTLLFNGHRQNEIQKHIVGPRDTLKLIWIHIERSRQIIWA